MLWMFESPCGLCECVHMGACRSTSLLAYSMCEGWMAVCVLVGWFERDKGAHMARTVGDGTQNSHMTWRIKIKMGERGTHWETEQERENWPLLRHNQTTCICEDKIKSICVHVKVCVRACDHSFVLTWWLGRGVSCSVKAPVIHSITLCYDHRSHDHCTGDHIFLWNYYSNVVLCVWIRWLLWRTSRTLQELSFDVKKIFLCLISFSFFLHLSVAGVFLTAIINTQWFCTSLYHWGL